MYGGNNLKRYEDFDSWYGLIISSESEEMLKEEKAPSQYLTISVKDKRLVGMVNTRHYLNEKLLKYGGL